MPSSEVAICNVALRHIKVGSINNLNERSQQAEYCRAAYPELRDQLLQLSNCNWSFARTIEPLQLLSDIDIPNKEYFYKYPNSCLSIQRLLIDNDSNDAGRRISNHRNDDCFIRSRTADIEYEVYTHDDKQVIGADLNELYIQYTRRILDPNQMTELFKKGLAYLMASELAIPLLGVDRGPRLADYYRGLYNEWVEEAKIHSSNERKHRPVDSEFITERN